jgi:DNA-binding MarR family transcriptional regulator
LADLTGLTTGAVTGIIDRLEQAGFARREKDPHDRRRVIVRIAMKPEVERRVSQAAGKRENLRAHRPVARISLTSLDSPLIGP